MMDHKEVFLFLVGTILPTSQAGTVHVWLPGASAGASMGYPTRIPSIQPNAPLMHPSSSPAKAAFLPAEMGSASVQNDGAEVQEVPQPGCTSKGRKKKGATRIKLGNFNPNEDVIIAKSYAEIADDPITSTGQRRERFWERITERYNDQRGDYPERSLRSLQSRHEVFKADVAKFASYHAQVAREDPSGMTDADKITRAAANFAALEERKFLYLHCWEIMKHSPKWQDLQGTTAPRGQSFGDNTINLDDDNTNPSASAGKRTMGRDSAKAAKKKANSSAGSSSSADYASKMQDLSLQRNCIMQEEAARKNERFQQLASIDEKRFEEMRNHNYALLEVEKEKIRIMRDKHELERQKEEKQEDEQILQIDLDSCTPAQRVYYEELQAEILEKIACRRRKRQGVEP